MKKIFVGLLVTLLSVTSFATITVHTDATAFAAAISDSGSDIFSDLLCNDMVVSPVLRTIGNFSYQASALDGFYNVCSTTGTSLSTNYSDTPIMFDQFSAGTTAFAVDFTGSDIDGNIVTGAGVNIVITDATGAQFLYPSVTGTTSVFMGFTSDQPIVSVGILATGQPGDYVWTTVNAAIVGTAL